MKAILISSYVPLLTGAGGSIGAYGIASSLQSSGFEVGICYTGNDKAEKLSDNYPFNFFDCSSTDLLEKKNSVTNALDQFNPSVVWIHPILEWEYFKPVKDKYPHVIIAGDPLDLIKKYRFRYDGAAEKNLLRRIVYFYRNHKEANNLFKSERRFMQDALRRGVVAAYGVGDLDYRQKQINSKIELCELAFPNYQQKVLHTGQKNFLVLGNFNTIHTRYGIEYFLKEVWPKCKNSSLLEIAVIRIVGGGRYPEKRLGPPPKSEKGFEYVGFAQSLLEEYRNAIAVLVAVPIKLGFRTRVLEAWVHGVPVIMDSSSGIGLPEAVHGQNCLIAKSPEEFVSHSISLINDDALRRRIAEGGRLTFETHYLSTNLKSMERYKKISLQAISKFKNEYSNS